MTIGAAPPGEAREDVASASVGWRRIAVLAAVVLAALSLYGGGVLLPYFVNGLHLLPLAEVADGAGPHDPNNLWPRDGWAVPVLLAGRAAVSFGPFVALAAIGVGIAWLAVLWRRPPSGRLAKSLALSVIVAASVAALLFLTSATGVALLDWRVD